VALDLLSIPVSQQLTAVYVAYFGRAPDPEGLAFWTQQYDDGLAGSKSSQVILDDIAESFRLSDEAAARFPFLSVSRNGPVDDASIESFVTAVFDNLFNRDPDADGLAFWTGEIRERLADGTRLGDILVDIAAGAQDSDDGADRTTLLRKIAAGETYAETAADEDGAFDAATARALIDRVTGEADEADAAEAGRALARGETGLVVAPDTAELAEDDSLRLDVLANDRVLTGEAVSLTVQEGPSHGQATVVDGAIVYSPEADFFGDDSLTYAIETPSGAIAAGSVELTVTPVNDPPEAVRDSASVSEDGEVAIDVLRNDRDPDGDDLTVAAVADGENGRVAIGSDGRVIYTPDPDFDGSDSFTYTVSDGNGGSDTGTVNVLVQAVGDPPVAGDDSAETVAGSAVTIPILDNDSDPDGGALMVTALSSPAEGTVTQNDDGTVTYTPADGFTGSESFTYTVTDADGGTAQADVEVTVQPAPDDEPEPPPPTQEPPPSGGDTGPVLDVTFTETFRTSSATAGLLDEIGIALQEAWDHWTEVFAFDPEAVIELEVDSVDDAGLLARSGAGSVRLNGEADDMPLPTNVARELQGQGDFTASAPDAFLDISIPSLDRLSFNGSGGDIRAEVVFTHELGHPLGFLGISDPLAMSVWDSFVETQGGQRVFTGPNAVAANGGEEVPLADDGSPHLSETDDKFKDMLMTPTLGNATGLEISAVEVGIMQDLGYTLNDPMAV